MRATRVVPIAAASALLMMGCSGPANEPEAESPTPTTEAPSTTPEESSEPEESGEPSEWDVAPSEDAPLLPGDEGPAEAGEGDAEDASNSAHDAV